MKSTDRFIQNFLRGVAMLVLAVLAASPAASAQANTYRVIHDFTSSDGTYPWGDLILDASANMYGVTALGDNFTTNCGSYGCGTVFKLSKTSSGGWQRTVLHAFTGGSDGWDPSGGLVFDAAGNLYGVTIYGGLNNGGILFELSPTLTGAWTETVIHSFGATLDGARPWSRLIFDTTGNLYGTTEAGGAFGFGTVFKFSPNSGGGWDETLLYSFTGGTDGGSPYTGVTFDSASNLYGTTGAGGNTTVRICRLNSGCGVIFELSPNSSGNWTEAVLHTFDGYDGWHSQNLIFDTAGNLYSATGNGGNLNGCGGFGCGVVYELSPSASGWTYNVIHVFLPGPNSYGGNGGSAPSDVALDSAGNLYGAAFYGGNYSACASLGCGVIYKLSRNTSGGWTEAVLHSFSGGTNGNQPSSNVIFDASGNLISTASHGGLSAACSTSGGCGVVFEIKP